MNQSKEQVASLVAAYLKGFLIGDITLTVDAEGIWRGALSWRVPVRPSRWPDRMTDYYESLANVEQAIAEQESVPILLATGEPMVS